MAAIKFTLNGKPQTVDVVPQMPLLWVLRDTLGMTGTKFGCGMALCGACTVHLNGQPIRSCSMPMSGVCRQESYHHRRPLIRQQPSRAARLDRGGRPAVRLLPVRTDHDGGRASDENRQSDRRRYRRSHAWQRLPLRNVSVHPPSRAPGCPLSGCRKRKSSHTSLE